MKKRLFVAGVVALLVVGALDGGASARSSTLGVSTAPAQAFGDPFDVTEFNICSRNCSVSSPQPDGSTFTDFGLNPVAEFLDRADVNGWPRIIALNEVCGQAAFILAANLPAGLYDASYYVSARRPQDGCDLFGNWVAVRTGDIPASEASEFHFFWGAGTPPPGDTTSESRGGACLRSFIFLEQTWGCSVHLDTDDDIAEDQADGLLADQSGWFGTTAQIMLGDFNLQPDNDAIGSWDNSDRDDIYEPLPVTYQGSGVHIDYGWAHQTVLEIPTSPFAIAYASSSDHHQLWGSANFR
jgi:hypothetical protein